MHFRNFAWIVAIFLVAVPSKNVFADTEWNSSSSFGNTQENNSQSAVMVAPWGTSPSDAGETPEHAESASISQSAIITDPWGDSSSNTDESPSNTGEPTSDVDSSSNTDERTSDVDNTLNMYGGTQAESISSLNGFEIRFGTSVPLGLAHAIVFEGVSGGKLHLGSRDYLNVTAAASIELGYRGKYVGVYLQQYIGGSIYKGDEFDSLADFSSAYKLFLYNPSQSKPIYKKNDTSFAGASYLTAKGFWNYQDAHYFIITLGVGVRYGMYADMPFLFSLDDLNDFEYGFSIKTGLGYEYRMSSHTTIGLYIEYAPYMVSFYYSDLNSPKEFVKSFIHVIQPSVNIGYTF